MNQKRAVLISIRPEGCDKIRNGTNTLVLRKSRPKQEPPFTCYIYQSGDYVPAYNTESPFAGLYEPGAVIGEFTCDYIMRHCEMANADLAEQRSGVKREKIRKYAKNGEVFGWHIDDLKIYPKPLPLKEIGVKRAPQSWYYVPDRRPKHG